MAAGSSAELVTRDYAGAVKDGLAVHVWHGRVNVDTVKAARRFIAGQSGRIRVVVAIIEDSASLPDEAARVELAALHDEQSLALVAVVHESTSFKGAAVRAILTGLHLLKATPYKTKVFAVVPDALRWLEREAPERFRGKDLGGFISALRERVGAQAA